MGGVALDTDYKVAKSQMGFSEEDFMRAVSIRFHMNNNSQYTDPHSPVSVYPLYTLHTDSHSTVSLFTVHKGPHSPVSVCPIL